MHTWIRRTQYHSYEVQEGEEINIDKSLYADDSTGYQGSDEGAQELVDGLSEFSAAVGIVIKPSKSHTCAHKCEGKIYVTTWGKTDDFALGEPTKTELEDVTAALRPAENV